MCANYFLVERYLMLIELTKSVHPCTMVMLSVDCIHLNSLFLLNVTPSLILAALNRFMNLSVIKLPQNLILVWLAEVLRCCSESCVATSNWYFGSV